MKLQPSLRQKKRYIVFEILSDKRISVQEVSKAVDKALLLFVGQLGISRASPMFLKEKFDLKKQRFIIKVNHVHVDECKAALALIKEINGVPVIIKSLTTSGTIKKANSYI